MSIFDKRIAFKPFEYPEVVKFKESIQHSYWLFSEWSYLADLHDYKVKLNDKERNTIKNCLLAISQVELGVKTWWRKLGDRFPKAEFEQVGVVFADSETRHSDAYSHLIEVLGLNTEFETLMEVPAIKGRVEYLAKYLKNSPDSSNENYSFNLALFSLFVENVSLFSQFLIIKAFNKHKNVLKDMDNVVLSTRYEETVHALFGITLIKMIKKEFPEWFGDTFYQKLYKACNKAMVAEEGIIDLIYEQGDLDFISKVTVKEYTKHRFNQSLLMLDGEAIFSVDEKELEKVKWFQEETDGEVSIDFFHSKSSAYSKKTKPINATDLF